MGKRLFDLAVATLGLVATSPLLLLAMALVPLASPGPAIYRARRAGRGGVPFTMYKLRTMHVGVPGGPITGRDDPRVFPLGRLLRVTKLDELPQLVNVIRGEMSIVGPRPEDPDVVADSYTPLQMETLSVRPGLADPGSMHNYTHGDRELAGDVAADSYTPLQMETLSVRPGLASPGSIYNYTHGERELAGDVADVYARELLPVKLALDLVYVREASLLYDLRVIARTAWVILARLAGRGEFPPPEELARAREVYGFL